MDILVKEEQAVTIFCIIGKVDTSNHLEFQQKLIEQIKNSSKNIHLNLEKLEYISSAGLRVFLIALKQCESMNLKLLLSQLDGNIKKIFEVSGFLKLFEIA